MRECDLHVSVVGQGPPGVVLHGGMGLDHRYLRPWLGQIAAPALVVVGDDDQFIPLEAAARRLAAGLPDGELAVVEAAGHFPFVEQPERFAHVVGGWLARRCPGLGAQ